MGRMKPIWYLKRQAAEAEARNNYYENRTPPETAEIKSRGVSVDCFYRSLLLRDGTEHLLFSTSFPKESAADLTLAQLGLLAALPEDTSAVRLKGSGIKPSKIQWYRGAANPTRRRTAWNTSVARYYDSAGGRSHFSAPFSKATGVFDGSDLMAQFNGLFGPGGTKRGLLGSANGRASLILERTSVSAQT